MSLTEKEQYRQYIFQQKAEGGLAKTKRLLTDMPQLFGLY
jgi:hypothetical protein